MESGGGGRDAAAAAAEAEAFTMLSRMRAVRTARRVPASFKILLVEEDRRLAGGDDGDIQIQTPKALPPAAPAAPSTAHAPGRPQAKAHSSFLAGDVNQNKTP